MKNKRLALQLLVLCGAVVIPMGGRVYAQAPATKADLDHAAKESNVNSLQFHYDGGAMSAHERESEHLLGLGYRLLAANNPQGAEAIFRKSAAMVTAPDEALFGLAQAQTAEGKHLDALKTYRALVDRRTRWISSMKSEPRVLMYYSLAAMQQNQWDEAVTAYNDALGTGGHPNGNGNMPLLSPADRLDPDKPEPALLKAMAHIGIGQHALRMGPNEEAVKQFTLAAQVAPSQTKAMAYRYLGDALRQSGKKVEAQAAYRKADRLH